MPTFQPINDGRSFTEYRSASLINVALAPTPRPAWNMPPPQTQSIRIDADPIRAPYSRR